MKRILVAYYTKFGSTREAAELIGAGLKKNHFEVTVLPLSDVSVIDAFDAVIIGAPINGMQWFPEATNFVHAHRDALSKKKTALFCLSYIYYTGGSFWKKAIEKAFDPAQKEISPDRTAIFGGRIDASLPRPMRFIFGIPATAPLSIFNPEAINNWASELARDFSGM